MSRLSLVGAWLLVVVAATTLTWQIVSAADEQVSDRPASLNVAAPAMSSLTTLAATPPTTGREASPTTSEPAGASETTGTKGQTTATTVSESGWETKSIHTSGGTIVVRYTTGEVAYQAATPGKGFHVEVEQYGPPEVEVKFRSQDTTVEVHAGWHDGGLQIEVAGPDGDD